MNQTMCVYPSHHTKQKALLIIIHIHVDQLIIWFEEEWTEYKKIKQIGNFPLPTSPVKNGIIIKKRVMNQRCNENPIDLEFFPF